MNETEQYFELLRFCLNEELPVPECIKDIHWHKLLVFATKQTIVGIFVPVVLMKDKRLTVESFRGNKPCDEDVMEWVFEEHRLRKNSKTAFERTVKASEWFLENGFRNCILKGQGNALMYPDPMLRTTGDIDIWCEGGRDKILAFTTKYYKMPYNWLHVDFPMFKDIDVEVHFRPSCMKNPITNKKLWKYFAQVEGNQFENQVTSADGKYKFFVPTNEFNTFYQLDHIFRHFIIGGVGLRQIIDYYYLLRKRYNDGVPPDANKELLATLKKFHLLKFAQAMMYIMKEILCLDDKYLYTEPNEKEGKFLLEEISIGGNFGKFETRKNNLAHAKNSVKRFLIVEKFNMRLLRHYPSEAIWLPYKHLKKFILRRTHDDDDD